MLHASLLVASTRPTWPDILVFAAAAAVILVGAVGVVTSQQPGARRPEPRHDALRRGGPLH